MTEDDFSTEVAQEGDATVIHVHGEIDMATCERLRDAIEPHLGPQQTMSLTYRVFGSWTHRVLAFSCKHVGR